MERTGGEPDVVSRDEITGEIIFVDCCAQTTADRRNLYYDHAALEAHKNFKPQNSAMNMAATMGIEVLTEEQCHEPQNLGNFDTKTSSWLKTPDDIRQQGGAIFGDRRFGRVFIFHNGADS